MRVLKFGGTSVANAECFIRVANILESKIKDGQVAAVLSAPDKITDYLIGMIECAINSNDLQYIFDNTKDVFFSLLRGLLKSQPDFNYETIWNQVNQEFSELQQILYEVSSMKKCSDSINASIICRGEKLSVSIMKELFKARGFGVTVIDPVKNLIADGNYLESIIDIIESRKRILKHVIPYDHIILMAGFTAGNKFGKPVTLGRHGSDYSAAVLSVCLRADFCEIWTDVDGIYTCDPHKVPDAKLLKSMSYKEARILSYFGAKILHPFTISTIAKYKIPCLIKNTTNPNSPGTTISLTNFDLSNPVKGVTYLNDMAVINISNSRRTKEVSKILRRAISVMFHAGISIMLIDNSSFNKNSSFCLPQKKLFLARTKLENEFSLELKDGTLKPFSIMSQLAVISVVGDSISKDRSLFFRIFDSMSYANIKVIAIIKGVSKKSISVVVKGNSIITSIKVIHQTIFNTNKIIKMPIISEMGKEKIINNIYYQNKWIKINIST